MPSKVRQERPARRGRLPESFHDDVGQRLRAEREARGVSLRQLARQLGISASALSQIETGRSRPSVSTLYAIVSELGMSLDELFAGASSSMGARAEDGTGAPDVMTVASKSEDPLVQRADSRRVLELESGVRWERLTPTAEQETDFLYVVYDVGGSSSGQGRFIRHSGREYGLVLSGTLRVTVGFEAHDLGPGDSVAFDSSNPHRLENVGDEPVRAVWFVRGRRQSDDRARPLQSDFSVVAGVEK